MLSIVLIDVVAHAALHWLGIGSYQAATMWAWICALGVAILDERNRHASDVDVLPGSFMRVQGEDVDVMHDTNIALLSL
jgi:hypothetical protein